MKMKQKSCLEIISVIIKLYIEKFAIYEVLISLCPYFGEPFTSASDALEEQWRSPINGIPIVRYYYRETKELIWMPPL